MALVCGARGGEDSEQWLAVASADRLVVADTGSPAAVELPVGGGGVVCATASTCGRFLVACTEDKWLSAWEAPGWRLIGRRLVVKTPTVLLVEGGHVLVGDKSGEVTRYTLQCLQDGGEPVLGHLSMLLAMTTPPGGRHIVTADRDEKIRVSNYPNAYNIASLCLGHTEFVFQLCFVSHWPALLLSGSGDGTIRSWHWESGSLLHTQTMAHASSPQAVTELVCCSRRSSSLAVASLERCCEVSVLGVEESGRLRLLQTCTVAGVPRSMALDHRQTVWLLLSDVCHPLCCLGWSEEEQLCACQHPLEQKCCQLLRAPGMLDCSSLRKHSHDNVALYLACKARRVGGCERMTPPPA